MLNQIVKNKILDYIHRDEYNPHLEEHNFLTRLLEILTLEPLSQAKISFKQLLLLKVIPFEEGIRKFRVLVSDYKDFSERTYDLLDLSDAFYLPYHDLLKYRWDTLIILDISSLPLENKEILEKIGDMEKIQKTLNENQNSILVRGKDGNYQDLITS